MNKESIKVELIDILSRLFYENRLDPTMIEYADLVDDLGIDSITFISMVVEIEERFGIEFPDDLLSLDNFRKINGIVDIVERESIDK